MCWILNLKNVDQSTKIKQGSEYYLKRSENVLLSVDDLKTYFHTENGVIPAVDGVTFDINRGETIALVGESGSGKSVTAFSIMNILGANGKIENGTILFEGNNLVNASERELRKIRGGGIGIISQEPLTSLNPTFTVGSQISEGIRIHQKVGKKIAKEKSIEMIKKVGIPRPEEIYSSFPHQLSGGMRQRIMIAIALSCSPKLLIADEPTTALDVTIQAQILKLIKQLSEEFETSVILITHDLGVVAETADRVIVMYAGQLVEEGNVYDIFTDPKHPYTKGLLDSTPNIHYLGDELTTIEGTTPSPLELPNGCVFQPRCPYAMDKCKKVSPLLQTLKSSQKVRCWLHEEEEISLYDSESE